MSLKDIRAFVNRHSKKVTFLLLFYFLMAWITAAYTKRKDNLECKETTKEFGGGVHRYDGQDYTFTLCDTGYSIVLLQIHDANNELWAERSFDVEWAGRISPLKYTNKSVTYFDNTEEEDFEKVISMPPNRWEWLKVRVIDTFWSVMEFIFIKPLKWVFS